VLNNQAATGTEGPHHLLQADPLLRDVEDRIADLAAIIPPVHDPAFQALEVDEALQSSPRCRKPPY